MLYNKHHNLHKSVTISGFLIAFLTVAFCADASEMTNGDARAAIRSADFPCYHVIKLETGGNNIWNVTCNSGKFRVKRDQNGKITVSQIQIE